MMRKVHFSDQHGAICGSEKITVIRNVADKPLHERGADVETVTCLKCARKLREWGFAIQSFRDVVRNAIK